MFHRDTLELLSQGAVVAVTLACIGWLMDVLIETYVVNGLDLSTATPMALALKRSDPGTVIGQLSKALLCTDDLLSIASVVVVTHGMAVFESSDATWIKTVLEQALGSIIIDMVCSPSACSAWLLVCVSVAC